ncbi:MAG TPA: ribose 5-phosphate isomerase B [Firmicutes bacterium]|nr:ribose 5-phosphate isomerase B [Bacillota bacterium]
MKIALASDHAGFLLKEHIKKYLEEKGIKYRDFGTDDETPVDYPDLALKAASAVQKGEFKKGIIICGTGIGVAITANKLKGIRAALCCDTFSARCARAHNDANILTLGARIIDRELALEIVDIFLNTAFEGGRHHRRIEKISNLEGKNNFGPID